eukprot:CAMPEP_0119409468 /NCGR_PEP_ID=MMETSP1335-20130426/2752_1 /TAXON_ID=259385 /ORGANISM="Chrysoculter rhomboideus, Strain RCC1486" /LENGTH=65 /DNA_ID=CAMNT_0007433849 /DNA_START=79 /DNA_END=273 /DNA_ORIENTATION=-
MVQVSWRRENGGQSDQSTVDTTLPIDAPSPCTNGVRTRGGGARAPPAGARRGRTCWHTPSAIMSC